MKSILLVLIFALAPLLRVQEKPAEGSQSVPRGHMMEMHKQEMAAMKADIEKMRASLAQVKANAATIRDPNELPRWRNHVDRWEALLGHMERMQKHMESMGSRYDGRPRHGRPASTSANREETQIPSH